MKFNKTVARLGLTCGLVVGLTVVALPAQAATDAVAAAPTAMTTASAPQAAPTCPVSDTQAEAALTKALKATATTKMGGTWDPFDCRIRLMVRWDRADQAMQQLQTVSGIRPILFGQKMALSTASEIVVEVKPSGKSCGTVFPVPPCAWQYQQIVLSPDMTGNGLGEILVVDDWARLYRFAFQKGNKLGQWANLGEKFDHVKIYGAGDWNGDGKADLIGIRAGQMLLYPGDGKGGIGKGIEIGHGWSKYTVIPAGDLTGDKIPDMLAINNQTGVLLLYTGNGKGGFKSGFKQVGHGWKNWQLFAAGDMNQDGKIDILGVKADGRLFFYAGRGDGTFKPAKQVGHGWKGMTLAAGADLDGDGKADIVGRTKSGDLLFYRGVGVGTFAKPVKLASNW